MTEGSRFSEPASADSWRDFRTGLDRLRADLLCGRLEAAGITARWVGQDHDELRDSVGAGQFSSLTVQVATDRWHDANLVLEQDVTTAKSRGAWQCGRCTEANEPTFDVCWSCGKAHDEDDLTLRGDDEPESPNEADAFASLTIAKSLLGTRQISAEQAANPYAAPRMVFGENETQKRSSRSKDAEGAVIRCLRFSTIAALAALVVPILSNILGFAALFGAAINGVTYGSRRGWFIGLICFHGFGLAFWFVVLLWTVGL